MKDVQQLVADLGVSPSVITADLISKHGGRTLLKRYNSMPTLLSNFVKDTPKGKIKWKTQKILMGVVQKILNVANTRILSNYKHTDLHFAKTSCILN